MIQLKVEGWEVMEGCWLCSEWGETSTFLCFSLCCPHHSSPRKVRVPGHRKERGTQVGGSKTGRKTFDFKIKCAAPQKQWSTETNWASNESVSPAGCLWQSRGLRVDSRVGDEPSWRTNHRGLFPSQVQLNLQGSPLWEQEGLKLREFSHSGRGILLPVK